MSSNTKILIKRSELNNTPGALNSGELAYSYASNTLFIGTAGSDSYLEIGGKSFQQYSESAYAQANAANDLATSGYAQANAANDLATSGYAQANAANDLATSGYAQANAATDSAQSAYNQANSANDLATSGYAQANAATESAQAAYNKANTIVTSFTISDGFNSNTVSSETTLTFTGIGGITTLVGTDESVTIGTDDTVLRSNTAIINQIIDGSLQVSGNLSVLGTQFVTNTVTLNIADPLIYLASNNYTSDIVDIGFAGNYYDVGTSTNRHAGVIRHAGDKDFYIFYNYDKELSGDNVVDIADPSFAIGNTHTNVISPGLSTFHTANVSSALNVSGTAHVNGTLDVVSAFTANSTGTFFSNPVTLAHGTTISDSVSGGLFVNSLNVAETSNVVFYNASTKELTYGTMKDLLPDSIANGIFSLAISDFDGALSYNGDQINFNSGSLSLSSSGFFVDPVVYEATQDATYDGIMFYNASTKEVRYSYTLDGGSF